MKYARTTERESAFAGVIITDLNDKNYNKFKSLLNSTIYKSLTNINNNYPSSKPHVTLTMFETNFIKHVDIYDDTYNLDISDMFYSFGYNQLTLKQRQIVNKYVNNDFDSLTLAISYLFNKYSIDDYTKFFNKIKKNYIKPYVINLYDKIKNNNVNYGNGDVIKDLVDTILTEITNSEEYKNLFNKKIYNIEKLLFERFKFDFTIIPVFFNHKIQIQDFGTDEMVKFDTDKKIEPNLSISEYFCTKGLQPFLYYRSIVSKLLRKILYSITLNNLNKLIKDYIFSLKEMKYIDTDCKSYFSRLATGTNEILVNYVNSLSKFPETMITPTDLKKYCRFMGDKLSKIFTDVLKMFVKPSNYNIGKEDLEGLRQFYTKYFHDQSNFVEYFGEYTATYNLLNNYHHDIRCWSDGAIDEKVEVDNEYQNFINIFIKNVTKLIDITINQAVAKYNKVSSNNINRETDINNSITIYRFIAVYFRMLKVIFNKSNIVSTNIKLHIYSNNRFDENIFKEGLIKDFTTTKSIVRLFKSAGLDDKLNEFAKDFVDNAWKYIYNLIITRYDYDKKEITFFDNGLLLYNTFKNFESEIRQVIRCYANTNAYHIYDYALGIISFPSIEISLFIKENTSRFIEDKLF